MPLVLIPDLGDLLRMQPQYNAGTVVELVRALGAKQVHWASSPDPDHPLRDALPAAGIALGPDLVPDWAWADAEHAQFGGFLKLYPQGRERLRGAGRLEAAFAERLGAPLTAADVLGADLRAEAQRFHDETRALLDEGPGTRWRGRRLGELAARLDGLDGVLIAPLDDVDALLQRLPGAGVPEPIPPGETSRLRALADRAAQLQEGDDLGALLEALGREAGDAVTPKAELDACAAGIRLAVGDVAGARETLERAAHALRGDEPRSLAGLVLARLGQVRDLLGERDLAVRTYRAVLALSYAPAVARETAETGLAQGFTLQG